MPQRPNILLLLSDEHGFRYMGHRDEADGGEPVRTPAFDRLAAGGTVFTDAYCQMPLCTPSRMCLLTGTEVRRCGAWFNESVLRPELPTVAKSLAATGYETALVGKMHLGGNQQFVGFRHRPYGDLTGKTGHQWEPIPVPIRNMRARTEHVGVTGIPESLIQDEVVAHETVAFLREQRHREADRPWFLCASFSRPHFPLTSPRRHFERYWPDGVTEPKVPASGDAWDHPMSVGMRRGFEADAIGCDEMMRARGAYFGCVSYLDEVVGDLLLRLETAGLLDNAIVVYTSDHGELAGEHGVWWKHGWQEGATHVPLIVSMPAQRSGEQPAQRVQVPVGLTDLYPTLCALGGADAPDDLDGVDISAGCRGEGDPPDRPIVSDNLVPRWGEGTEFRMVRQGSYKYVRFRNAPPLMFDVKADPGEQRDLISRGCDGAAAEMRDKLAAFAEESMDFDGAERDRTERDADLRERYAQPPSAKNATGNLYIMPDGRVVNADDPLYDPTVIFDDPARDFGDWPG
jgi:choline-sulfatase